MPKIIATKYTKELAEALRDRGVTVEEEHWDKHKHVDIYIPDASMYSEIDGIQHLTDPKQIIADFNRSHYSDVESFDTLHIPNLMLKFHLRKIADAIFQVVEKRIIDKKSPKKLDKDFFQSLVNNLNRNVAKEHIENVEKGIHPADDDYFKFKEIENHLQSSEDYDKWLKEKG